MLADIDFEDFFIGVTQKYRLADMLFIFIFELLSYLNEKSGKEYPATMSSTKYKDGKLRAFFSTPVSRASFGTR